MRILVMIPLMHTLFPLPVAPATRRWGILFNSASTASPVISRPKPICNFDPGLLCCFESITSRKETIATSELGTSIPMADFPGIGASILISFAAKASARSSFRLTILLTLTPTSGWTSYFVTAGPRCTWVTLAFTPKLWNVRSSLAHWHGSFRIPRSGRFYSAASICLSAAAHMRYFLPQ